MRFHRLPAPAPAVKSWFRHHFNAPAPEIRIAMTVESVRAVITGMKSGLGLGIVPSHAIGSELKDRTLVRVQTGKREMLNRISLVQLQNKVPSLTRKDVHPAFQATDRGDHAGASGVDVAALRHRGGQSSVNVMSACGPCPVGAPLVGALKEGQAQGQPGRHGMPKRALTGPRGGRWTFSIIANFDKRRMSHEYGDRRNSHGPTAREVVHDPVEFFRKAYRVPLGGLQPAFLWLPAGLFSSALPGGGGLGHAGRSQGQRCLAGFSGGRLFLSVCLDAASLGPAFRLLGTP